MSAGFRVLVTRRAERDIADLDPVARRRVQTALLDLERDPTAEDRRRVGQRVRELLTRVAADFGA